MKRLRRDTDRTQLKAQANCGNYIQTAMKQHYDQILRMDAETRLRRAEAKLEQARAAKWTAIVVLLKTASAILGSVMAVLFGLR